MSIPFHKQTDPKKQAGQIVFSRDEVTLNQYIARKTEPGLALESGEFIPAKALPSPSKKMTFDEWYAQNQPGRFWNTGEFNEYLKQVWVAAQENK